MKRLNSAGYPATMPKAAAIAGIVFSSLMIVSLGIIRLAFPDAPTEHSTSRQGFGNAIVLVLHLVPFAGIAFLWLLGVLRDRKVVGRQVRRAR
jgi:hypothetical protein